MHTDLVTSRILQFTGKIASHTWSERLFIIHRASVSKLAELMFVGNLFEPSLFAKLKKRYLVILTFTQGTNIIFVNL